eukprot:TRINITY_DN48190_c0_g1_i1.p1 TRINITY_DN48190_c0_g1~~TRINITY_DN48190_c0_g1_i1.p1  ORF type:complete len:154 (+),score=15.56 TRINITY_DN48190_c0_g1_i1:39-500(+)
MLPSVVIVLCILQVAAAARSLQGIRLDNIPLLPSLRQPSLEPKAMVSLNSELFFTELPYCQDLDLGGSSVARDWARTHVSDEMFSCREPTLSRNGSGLAPNTAKSRKSPTLSLYCFAKCYRYALVAALVTLAGTTLLAMTSSQGIESAIVLGI